MIIRVIGGNGAGKSHVVHRILGMYSQVTTMHRHLLCEGGGGMQNVMIPGHYRIANGGLDTVPSGETLDGVRLKMIEHARAGWHVLYEVSSQKEGSDWMLGLHRDDHACRPVLLTTDDDERVASVRRRGHGIREDLIRTSGRKAEKLTMELSAGGVPIMVADRAGALRLVVDHLRRAS